jgi:hypothetical protein
MQMSIGSSASSNWILVATGYLLTYNILDFSGFGNEKYPIHLYRFSAFFHALDKLLTKTTPTPKYLLTHSKNTDIIIERGNKMGSRVKPVQPTEIKDKKIAREVIEQIRKPIPASVYKRHEEKAAYIDKFFK